MAIEVEFIVPEAAIEALEGRAVVAVRADGQQFTGILEQHIPADGHTTLVYIRDVITNELVVGTDVRNLGRITVP